MMFNQNGNSCRIVCLFAYLFIMVAVCSSSSVLHREVEGAGAGHCNGDRGTDRTFCYGHRNGDRDREADVQRCFDKLYGNRGLGCWSESQGRCRCTVDSSYIPNYSQTFSEARERLYQECHGFTNNIMERYEGNMYLTATCI